MAARKGKGKSGGGGGNRRAAAAAAAAPEVVEEVDTGMSIDQGIVLTTTVLMIGAVVLVAMAYQKYKVGG